MKPEIDYVYNKLKQLRFDFKESDRKLFPKDYRFDYGLYRWVRVDGNDLYISKDTFKPLEEELEYADRCHNLEEELGCSLEEAINVLFLGLQHTELYPCLTCTNNMHNDFGCDGSCRHDREFTQAEILSILKRRLEHSASK